MTASCITTIKSHKIHDLQENDKVNSSKNYLDHTDCRIHPHLENKTKKIHTQLFKKIPNYKPKGKKDRNFIKKKKKRTWVSIFMHEVP